jgi:hypothetical protein
VPLLGFKKQFAMKVRNGLRPMPFKEIGIKRQTIRSKRKDGKNPHPGETLYLYTGLRTKGCTKLGEAVCKGVEEITINWLGANVSGMWLTILGCEQLAIADGFGSFREMQEWFDMTHGDLYHGFSGLLIKW